MIAPPSSDTGRANRSRARARILSLVALVLAIALAVRLAYRSPYDASDLRVTPDEVEYAVCARRIATLGRYDLDIDGLRTPPHSTPWFSALLAPAYLVAPGEIGNGIWVVLAFAVVGAIAVQRIGVLVAGPIGGATAVIALLALRPYPYVARAIMTDGPSVAIAFFALWLFVRTSADTMRVRSSCIAGCIVAAAFALRSPYLSLAVPFAWRAMRTRERRALHWIALGAPIALVVVLNAIYNQTTFEDWRRTGYQFWCAVPYDYPDLLLSMSYVDRNLRELAVPATRAALAIGALGTLALAVRRPPRWKELVGFVLITALPISALHLVYFYSTARFHIDLVASSAVLGGIGLASLVPAAQRETRASLVAAIALLAAALAMLRPFDLPAPTRREAADLVHASTADDAVIVSGLEPVYLAATAPSGSRRMYLAASRDVEFASKVLVWTRIDRALAAPRDALDHAASGLLSHGGRWAVDRTADEMHAQIDAAVHSGREVFVETAFLKDPIALQRMLGDTLHLADPSARLTRIAPN